MHSTLEIITCNFPKVSVFLKKKFRQNYLFEEFFFDFRFSFQQFLEIGVNNVKHNQARSIMALKVGSEGNKILKINCLKCYFFF